MTLTNLPLRKGHETIMPALGTVRARSAPGIWQRDRAALSDPEMIDNGDPPPSGEAASTLKRLVEQAEQMLPNPAPHPHIELFEGYIRLIGSNPLRNIRFVIASRRDRRRFVYHQKIQNGVGINEGTVEATPENLAYWLTVLQS